MVASLSNFYGKTWVGFCLNPLSANPTKWSNTLKQFVGNLPMNCLSVFDHFVRLALKGLTFENGFSESFHFKANTKSIGSSKQRY